MNSRHNMKITIVNSRMGSGTQTNSGFAIRNSPNPPVHLDEQSANCELRMNKEWGPPNLEFGIRGMDNPAA